ncbi:MAG: GNAT family N-acetyltransferase [Gammaproteobacteria bacterium]
MDISVIESDLDDDAEGHALVKLLDSYAVEPNGQSAPIDAAITNEIVPGLKRHPTKLVLLAVVDEVFAGAAVCFWVFSTFTAKPVLNIHDLVVLPEYRGQGIGTALLDEAESRARAAGASRMTLEVRDSNRHAKRLYERYGFGPWSDPTLFVTKPLP